ncbi:hypothetical protein ALP75_201430 [Pseudomonas syringae pv. actinidiae]|nr:hypothetical protein ALP75_201430 [Pseudomonas syringae pv. actinidiae]
MLGFHIADLTRNQLQLGRQLLDALGEGVAGAFQFVLSRLHLRQLFQLGRLFGAQGLAATEVFQRFLGIQHLLIQRFGLHLARRAVGSHGLLGFKLLEFFVQAFFLIAQCRAIGQRLQSRWLNARQIDCQPRHDKLVALEAVQNGFQRFDPRIAIVQRDALFAQWQAEQGAVEQAHQAFDIRLRELFAQPGIAVVVGVIELLLHRLEAFFQVPQALVQVFGAELPGLGQCTGQFIVRVFGRQQLLLQHLGIIDECETILEHRQLAHPALNAADLTLQAHQLLRTAALVVLHFILLRAIVLGLDDQFFLARTRVIRPGAQQRIEHR